MKLRVGRLTAACIAYSSLGGEIVSIQWVQGAGNNAVTAITVGTTCRPPTLAT